MFGCYVWGKCQKAIRTIIVIVTFVWYRKKWGKRQFDRFYSWKCLGSCLSNYLCVTGPKNETGDVREEMCGFLWENAGKTTLKPGLVHGQLSKC